MSETQTDDVFGEPGSLGPASDPYSFLVRANLSCQHWAIYVLLDEQKKGTPTASERLAMDDEIKFATGSVSRDRKSTRLNSSHSS